VLVAGRGRVSIPAWDWIVVDVGLVVLQGGARPVRGAALRSRHFARSVYCRLGVAAANRLATSCVMTERRGGVRTLSVVRTSRRLSHLRSSVSQDFLRKPEGERLH